MAYCAKCKSVFYSDAFCPECGGDYKQKFKAAQKLIAPYNSLPDSHKRAAQLWKALRKRLDLK